MSFTKVETRSFRGVVGSFLVRELLDERQPPNIVGRIEALTARRERGPCQSGAPLPDAQGRDRHAEHARHGTAAVKGRACRVRRCVV